MKEKNECPTMSRKDHNKKSDHPKGGKFWQALAGVLANPIVQTGIKVLGAANSQGQKAAQGLEEQSKARMRAKMGKGM